MTTGLDIDARFPEAMAWIDRATNLYEARLLIPRETTSAERCGIHPIALRNALAILFSPRFAPEIQHAGPAFVEEIARTVALAEAHYENGATPDEAMMAACEYPSAVDTKRCLACATYFRGRNMWDEGESKRTRAEREGV